MYRFRIVSVLAGVLLLTVLSMAHDGKDKTEPMEPHAEGAMKMDEASSDTVTLIGQVIDPVCYIRHDSKGTDHKECALECAKGGITLGILEDQTGKIHIAFPEEHGDPNEKLLKFAEEHVKVTGTMYSRGGLTGIVVEKIEKVEKD